MTVTGAIEGDLEDIASEPFLRFLDLSHSRSARARSSEIGIFFFLVVTGVPEVDAGADDRVGTGGKEGGGIA